MAQLHVGPVAAAAAGDPDRQRPLGVGPGGISSSDAAPTLVYDFGGFAPMYFRMRYDTPDAAALGAGARRARRRDVHQQPAAASTTAPGCR